MIATENFAQVEVSSVDDLRAWLGTHCDRTESFWLVRFKKSVPDKFIDRLTLLDELLCVGWIDGIARKLDDQRTMQLICQRKQQAWTQTYKDRAARLIAEQRMQPAGFAAIERSKTLGLWNANADVDALLIPADLADAFSMSAANYFDQAAPSYRRNVLRWLKSAKTDGTRAKRIAAIVDFCANAKRIPQM